MQQTLHACPYAPCAQQDAEYNLHTCSFPMQLASPPECTLPCIHTSRCLWLLPLSIRVPLVSPQPPTAASTSLSSSEFLAVYNIFLGELKAALAANDQVCTASVDQA